MAATAAAAASRGAAAGGRAAKATKSKPIPQAKSGLAHEFDESGSGPKRNSSADPAETPAPAAAAPSPKTPRSGPPPAPRTNWAPSRGGVVDDGATVVLVVLTWAYFVLPFIVGGKARVKAVLMAKFLNRKPDGSFLP